MKKKSSAGDMRHIERTLKFLTDRREAPKATIAIYVVIYVGLTVMISMASRAPQVIMIGDKELPFSAFAGVFSSLANISIILMVLFYKKLGLITALVTLSVQFPLLLRNVFVIHNYGSIPGIFTNILTIITIVIIYLNQRKVERQQKRMQRLFEQTATALVNAIDAKDKYTHGHSARVAQYSRMLAEMAKKSDKECDEVYYTALLHDVGKIGIPDHIINKDGKLTNEEYETIKRHPAMGAQILEDISEYPYLSTGAHYHHERYDGKGYPEGLKGDDIPEIARIVSVADAYDAMTSKRSYRDPIPQQKVREEIVKGTGTQFDPEYARLMLHLIDLDTDYMMKELSESGETGRRNELVIGKHRSVVSAGILITSVMTTIRMNIGPEEKNGTPVPSMVLFDSLDGRIHETDKKNNEMMYFEYGEVWLDGRTEVAGARKMQVKTEKIERSVKSVKPVKPVSSSVRKSGEYRIEAVRIKDHALIRVVGRKKSAEIIVALPDSSRFMYIGLTGEHCRISDLRVVKADKESPADCIPRIAEEISFINVPAGDIPNVQVDGYRSDASEGVPVRDGLRLRFHVKCLPTAMLMWHCPFIDLFCSDDGKVSGENYRDLAFIRFDGEAWNCDPNCVVEQDVSKTEEFTDWEAWKQFHREGYDTTVTFRVEGGRITVITENSGVSVRSSAVMTDIDRPIYAAVTGDQVAITNIRII